MPVKERIHYLDAIKGMAMLMVIVYHTHLFPEIYVAPFLSPCVPLFFCVNGFLTLRKAQDYTGVLKKAFRLLSLVVFWSIICVGTYSFCRDDSVELQTFKSYILFPEEPYNVHLWFLYAIIGLLLISPAVKAAISIEKKSLIGVLIILVFFTFQGIRSFISPYCDFFNFATAFSLVYFIAGFLLFSNVFNLERIRSLYIWLAFAFCVVFQYGHNFLATLPSFERVFTQGSPVFAGYNTIFTLITTLAVASLFKRTQNTPPQLRWFGENSLGVYLIHYPIMRCLECVESFSNSNLLLTIGVIVASAFIVWVLKSNKVTRIIISL